MTVTASWGTAVSGSGPLSPGIPTPNGVANFLVAAGLKQAADSSGLGFADGAWVAFGTADDNESGSGANSHILLGGRYGTASDISSVTINGNGGNCVDIAARLAGVDLVNPLAGGSMLQFKFTAVGDTTGNPLVFSGTTTEDYVIGVICFTAAYSGLTCSHGSVVASNASGGAIYGGAASAGNTSVTYDWTGTKSGWCGAMVVRNAAAAAAGGFTSRGQF